MTNRLWLVLAKLNDSSLSLSLSRKSLLVHQVNYVSLEESIRGFNMILSGELDDLPEQAFYLVGNIDEAIAKAEKMKSKASNLYLGPNDCP